MATELNAVRVQSEDFSVPDEYALIAGDNSDGAVVTFVGKVRDFNDGSAVTDLSSRTLIWCSWAISPRVAPRRTA